MNGRHITRKEMAEFTAKYLSLPHPPIELNLAQYLVCRCAEFGCAPHQAHFHELRKFNEEATGVFAKRKVVAGVTGDQEMAEKSA
jgi:hypothetical protein